MAASYNLIDYAQEYLYTFEERPFNEVDSLIFSWLTYLHFEASAALREAEEPERTEEQILTPAQRRRRQILKNASNRIANWKLWDRELFGRVFNREFEARGVELRELYRAEEFEGLVQDVHYAEERLSLLTAMAASPRYRHVQLYDYRNEMDAAEEESGKQFAAVTYQISPELFYVAYRGTDHFFVGWKEDFYLAIDEPVPSQRLALSYLEEMADLLPGRIMVGGHSKGGNLAVDAAARCREAVQERIAAVYTHDGPGFLGDELKYEGFARIRDRIQKTIPQSSVIGLAFQQEAEYQIIESNESGINQHEPLTWQVEDNHFVYRDELTPDAKKMYFKVNNWLNQLSMEDRRKFIDGVFSILEQSGTDNFGELYTNWQSTVPAALKALVGLDEDMQKFLAHTVKQFIQANSHKSMEEEPETEKRHRLHLHDLHLFSVRGSQITVDPELQVSDDGEAVKGAKEAAGENSAAVGDLIGDYEVPGTLPVGKAEQD